MLIASYCGHFTIGDSSPDTPWTGGWLYTWPTLDTGEKIGPGHCGDYATWVLDLVCILGYSTAQYGWKLELPHISWWSSPVSEGEGGQIMVWVLLLGNRHTGEWSWLLHKGCIFLCSEECVKCFQRVQNSKLNYTKCSGMQTGWGDTRLQATLRQMEIRGREIV